MGITELIIAVLPWLITTMLIFLVLPVIYITEMSSWLPRMLDAVSLF
jgi:C4-dicarboxylate transporter, DctM subunit